MTTKKESTIKTDVGRINSHIRPLIGKKKISKVTRKDVERVLSDVAKGKTAKDEKTERGRSIVKGGKGTATRTVRLLGAIFTYRSTKIKVLFVGESPPAGGVFFYKQTGQVHSQFRQALAQHIGESPSFVEAFQQAGFYLDDLVLEPVNWLPDQSGGRSMLQVSRHWHHG